MELFIPIVYIPYVAAPVSREIVRKWRPPVEADDHIVGDLRAALVSLAVVVQAWFLYQNNHRLTLDEHNNIKNQGFILL